MLYFEFLYLATSLTFCPFTFSLFHLLSVTCNTFKTRTGRVTSDSCSREERLSQLSSRQTGFLRDKISPLDVDGRPLAVAVATYLAAARQSRDAMRCRDGDGAGGWPPNAEAQCPIFEQLVGNSGSGTHELSWREVQHEISICLSSNDVVSDAEFSNNLHIQTNTKRGEGDSKCMRQS